MAKTATQTVSFADTKAHFSKYVDEAEHLGRRTVITRHGKPAAVLVPVSVGMTEAPKAAPRMTLEEAAAWLDQFKDMGDPNVSAVDDLIAGRR